MHWCGRGSIWVRASPKGDAARVDAHLWDAAEPARLVYDQPTARPTS